MKLRKALEKAKQNREAHREAEEIIKKPEPEKVKGEGSNDWQPPGYSQSMHVELNTQTVLNNRCVCIEPESVEVDCYKVLRTKIQQLTQQKGWNSVMITSTLPGEGKTLTAVNLALTFAKTYNQTVMLVDCDLRYQNVHKILGIQSESGLIEYLVDGRPLQESIIWPGIDKLTLMSGGRTIQDSTELLGSPRMQTLVKEMKSRYDDRYVLFDVPPLLIGADALALVPYIDCIIMVVDEGKTSAKNIQKAMQVLPKEKFLGFVMNRMKSMKLQGYEYYK